MNVFKLPNMIEADGDFPNVSNCMQISMKYLCITQIGMKLFEVHKKWIKLFEVGMWKRKRKLEAEAVEAVLFLWKLFGSAKILPLPLPH